MDFLTDGVEYSDDSDESEGTVVFMILMRIIVNEGTDVKNVKCLLVLLVLNG